MAGAAGGVKSAQAEAQQAAVDAKNAETQLASGGGGRFDALHELWDRARHADLRARGAQAKAEEERVQARLDALKGVGAEIDRVAAAEPGKALQEALAEVAQACAKVRALADEHDAVVAHLVSYATRQAVEPKAPAGPRASSAHVAVEGRSVLHRATKLVPVREHTEEALRHVLDGGLDRARAMVRPVVETPAQKRPDNLLRAASGMLLPFEGPLPPGMQAQVNSGELKPLSDFDIDRWMTGELA